ncbi:MAG: orotidine-5'-phosphate decarboxylase [Patescibacteria group bacterium]
MKNRNFREMLRIRQEEVNSLVCVGLDPLPEKMPRGFAPEYARSNWCNIEKWMCKIVDVTAGFVSLFKLQRAHYEAIINGESALRGITIHIHDKYPDIPVFLDCKRGDIGRTQERYRVAHFGVDMTDGMNFSPYMGKDCMEYLVDNKNYPGRAIVGLCYTSNPSAREVQDVRMEDGRYYWELIAEKTLKWAEDLGIVDNAGLVMAAAYEHPKGTGNISSYHLLRCREIVGDKLWFLIPGIGTQGGFIEETVKAAYTGPGSIAINSSSGIIFASQDNDFAEAAAQKAKELRDEINKYR